MIPSAKRLFQEVRQKAYRMRSGLIAAVIVLGIAAAVADVVDNRANDLAIGMPEFPHRVDDGMVAAAA
jgi:hypothetical protein